MIWSPIGVQKQQEFSECFFHLLQVLILFILPLALSLPGCFCFSIGLKWETDIASAFTGLDASTETVSFVAFASQSPRHHLVSTNHDTRLPPWRMMAPRCRHEVFSCFFSLVRPFQSLFLHVYFNHDSVPTRCKRENHELKMFGLQTLIVYLRF